MIFPLIVLFSVLPVLNTQDTETDKVSEYNNILDSPVLWVHAFLLIWGLISALILCTSLREFCLLDRLLKRGKPLCCLSFFLTAFLLVHFMFNILLFEIKNSPKAKRLIHCLLSFAIFSVLCTLPIPEQVKEDNALLDSPGFYIAIMPLIVEIILGIARVLLRLIFKCCFPDDQDRMKREIIADIIIAIIVVACLARQIYYEVGLNEFRNKLWIKNFAQSIAPNMTFVNLIIILGHYWIFCLLKMNCSQNSEKMNKFLTGMLRPEMLSLMELQRSSNKVTKIDQAPQLPL